MTNPICSDCSALMQKEQLQDCKLFKCINPKCGHFYTVSDLKDSTYIEP